MRISVKKECKPWNSHLAWLCLVLAAGRVPVVHSHCSLAVGPHPCRRAAISCVSQGSLQQVRRQNKSWSAYTWAIQGLENHTPQLFFLQATWACAGCLDNNVTWSFGFYFRHMPKSIFSLALLCVSFLLSALQSDWTWTRKLLKSWFKTKHLSWLSPGAGGWDLWALRQGPSQCFASYNSTSFLHTWGGQLGSREPCQSNLRTRVSAARNTNSGNYLNIRK